MLINDTCQIITLLRRDVFLFTFTQMTLSLILKSHFGIIESNFFPFDFDLIVFIKNLCNMMKLS